MSAGFGGARGAAGATGATGATGPSSPLAIPSGSAEVTTPFVTSSGTYVDVTGASCVVTIPTGSAYIWSHVCVTWSASNETIGVRLVIGAQNGNPTEVDDKGLSNTTDVSMRTSAPVAAAAITVKLQVRSVTGGAVTVEHVDLFAIGLMAS